jgi:hypothetical protein
VLRTMIFREFAYPTIEAPMGRVQERTSASMQRSSYSLAKPKISTIGIDSYFERNSLDLKTVTTVI